MKRIKRFGVLQTSKFFAALYFIMTAIFIVPITLVMMATGAESNGYGYFIILAPFIYAIFGFVFVAIACFLYNIVASKIGGIEIEVE